ncbi:hypothetical protein Tcan_10209 [Toxocara canis]|uniref:Uncharacterized protein n=1 Tax=Toxocara canis TaxID=6265 RepID=A0A0B2UZX2_TOXCA|nr:hypothetical protein Tcan_10209 [Toxocara canis]
MAHRTVQSNGTVKQHNGVVERGYITSNAALKGLWRAHCSYTDAEAKVNKQAHTAQAVLNKMTRNVSGIDNKWHKLIDHRHIPPLARRKIESHSSNKLAAGKRPPGTSSDDVRNSAVTVETSLSTTFLKNQTW